jgi:hypothetical protein
MTTEDQIKAIKAGKQYPSYVKVTEPGNPTVEFHLNSFYVGMYCAIYVNGKVAAQTGDHNNKKCVAGLKKDLLNAIKRGATVELGSIRDCKLEIDK